MTYNINFALNLNIDNSTIIYKPEVFADNPILISTSVAVEIIKKFIKEFEIVGIEEKNRDKTNKNTEGKHYLKSLSGEAFIRKVRDVSPESIKNITINIAEYLNNSFTEITADSLYSEECSIKFAELRELIEIRNYMFTYIINKKKLYEKGYIFIMEN